MTKRKWLFCAIGLMLMVHATAQQNYNTYKPWTYWWWMGSAVNKTDLKHQLQGFSDAGLGGVHIIPIYGAKGYESSFLPFLSEPWLEMVQFTIQEAQKLGLGVDITLGTGWPYGGAWVDTQHAAKKLLVVHQKLGEKERVELLLDSIMERNHFLRLLAVFATNEKGKQMDLTPYIVANKLSFALEKGKWKLTYFGVGTTNQLVKRAAPGGEGLVIDYFDRTATQQYLSHFDTILGKTAFSIAPRAYYHDSYETYGADWTLAFSDKFQAMNGYDLKDFLPILLDTAHVHRKHFIHDIRATLSALLYTEFASTWTEWSNKRQKITRYQAHGSPGNLLDLYALADVPETESFGCSDFSIPKLDCDEAYEEARFGRPNPLMMKFASSPAHLWNKPLVSSETGTWLANHFKVSLRQIKPQIDELFVAGINHIFYHGSTYSPKVAGFPGWLFYASTNFGQSSHFWQELPYLNQYVTNTQQILQNSLPDNDILLYFPINDLWTKYPGNILLMFDVHKYANWFSATDFGKTAEWLWENGYSFDYVSDKQLQQLQISDDGKLFIQPNSTYSTILVPPMDYVNASTLAQLQTLAAKGANLIFLNHTPSQYAGLQANTKQNSDIASVINKLVVSKNVKLSSNLKNTLSEYSIRQESIKLQGLSFIRKRTKNDYYYFVSNLSHQFHRDSITLATKGDYVQIIDPQYNTSSYLPNKGKFFLTLPPGKSCFLKVTNTVPTVPLQLYYTNHDTVQLSIKWEAQVKLENKIRTFQMDTLKSWTTWGNTELQYFCGKVAYKTTFNLNRLDKKAHYQILFDNIYETATVTINGVNCGTIWSLPYQLIIPKGVLKKTNNMTIEVQNGSANAIKQIDMQKKAWKNFYDINFVDIQYKPFDASAWELMPSGLVGKVYLVTSTKK